MKTALILVPVLCASCASVPGPQVPPPSESRDSQIALYFGQRNLDEDDYDPVEEQGTIGVEFSRQDSSDSIGWEVGVFASRDKGHTGGLDVEGTTREAFGGVRVNFGEDTVRPYVGAGLAVIRSEVDVEGFGDDDDASAAAYFHAGVGVRASESVRLGIDVRFLLGSDLEIGGVDTDADYGQLAFFIGFGL